MGVGSGNNTSSPWEFQNLGFLYDEKFVGNGGVLFCPSFANAPGSVLTEQTYATPTFMSTDSGLSGGTPRVRSSIDYNPHADTTTNLRLFQKTSDVNHVANGGHRLFAMDYVGGGSIGTTTPTGYNPYNFPHYPSKGWDVLFTDGSAKLCKSIPAFNMITVSGAPGYFGTSVDTAAPATYEPFLQALEAAP